MRVNVPGGLEIILSMRECRVASYQNSNESKEYLPVMLTFIEGCSKIILNQYM